MISPFMKSIWTSFNRPSEEDLLRLDLLHHLDRVNHNVVLFHQRGHHCLQEEEEGFCWWGIPLRCHDYTFSCDWVNSVMLLTLLWSWCLQECGLQWPLGDGGKCQEERKSSVVLDDIDLNLYPFLLHSNNHSRLVLSFLILNLYD